MKTSREKPLGHVMISKRSVIRPHWTKNQRAFSQLKIQEIHHIANLVKHHLADDGVRLALLHVEHLAQSRKTQRLVVRRVREDISPQRLGLLVEDTTCGQAIQASQFYPRILKALYYLSPTD